MTATVGQTLGRPRLRVPWQRGSTAHVASIYPFSVHGTLCQQGPVIGVDMLAGGGEFLWDPFEAYHQGLTTNPNVAVFGQPGQRKSTLVKTFLWRMFTLYQRRRWVGVADPKGEYVTLAERLGLTVVRLAPGGGTRVNPLAPGPAARHEHPAKTAMRRADTVHDLLAAVLRRNLAPAEEAILYAAVEAAVTGRAKEPTLADLAGLLTDPTAAMVAQVRKSAGEVAAQASDLYYALGNLIGQSLRGMFDGPGTVQLDSDGLGVVLDLSGFDINSPAMPLVLMCATGWLQEFLVCPGPQRLQITDELWVGAGDRHFVRHMQRCQKLGRSLGVANLQIAHKVTDAAAQSADGTAESKIAAGLLADTDTKIILRQDPEQLGPAQQAFGLTDTERHWIGSLVKGRALWLIGGQRAVVQHHLADSERPLVDTDQRMRTSGLVDLAEEVVGHAA
jgi:type IV secretory pathway VirB4 component